MSLVQQMVYYVPMLSQVTKLDQRLFGTSHSMISGLETSRRNYYRVFASKPAFISLSQDWRRGLFPFPGSQKVENVVLLYIYTSPLGAPCFCFCGKMCVDSPLWNHLTQLQNWGVPGLENRSRNHLGLLPVSMILTNSCGWDKGKSLQSWRHCEIRYKLMKMHHQSTVYGKWSSLQVINIHHFIHKNDVS